MESLIYYDNNGVVRSADDGISSYLKVLRCLLRRPYVLLDNYPLKSDNGKGQNSPQDIFLKGRARF